MRPSRPGLPRGCARRGDLPDANDAGARASAADQPDARLPGSEPGLRDAARDRVVGRDPARHAQPDRTIPASAFDLRRPVQSAAGARLPGRGPAAVADRAAAGTELCGPDSGADLAGAPRRPGATHLRQPGQLQSLRPQHRYRRVSARRAERQRLSRQLRHLSELPACIEHREHPLPRHPYEPEQHRRQRLPAGQAAAARQSGQPDHHARAGDRLARRLLQDLRAAAAQSVESVAE